jgi:hypothetical protein
MEYDLNKPAPGHDVVHNHVDVVPGSLKGDTAFTVVRGRLGCFYEGETFTFANFQAINPPPPGEIETPDAYYARIMQSHLNPRGERKLPALRFEHDLGKARVDMASKANFPDAARPKPFVDQNLASATLMAKEVAQQVVAANGAAQADSIALAEAIVERLLARLDVQKQSEKSAPVAASPATPSAKATR